MSDHHSPPTPLVRAIGAAIRRRRELMHMTLKDVAGRSGLSLGYLSQIERADSGSSIDTLEKVCQAFGITMIQLMILADVQLRLPDIEAGALANPPYVSEAVQ